MEYKIRCNKCGDVFKASTERQGLQKVRCPYCGSVLNCQLERLPQKQQRHN